MPLETLLTNPNPAVPRSRSLLSYFSNPLSKHSRNTFDLTIEPEDPFRVYGPGQAVRGHVVLTVTKGFDITHLVIALHGFAKVYKHQIVPGEAPPGPEMILTGKGTRGFEYHGNGQASLFQSEQILCGNGFLKKSVYKFAFEVPFPAKSLPSTISFERGSINYFVTATLTRPTTISPVTTRTTKVKFQDNIDIASMYSAKSRVISLEPVSKRGKVKVKAGSSSVTTGQTSSAGQLTRNNTHNSNPTQSSASIAQPPLSPAPSEDTDHTNATTTSSPSFQLVEQDSAGRKHSPQTSDTRSNTTSSSTHTITATTELPRHGALPGETMPIRIHITHTKSDVRGVILCTLYRQGRVDLHPPLPLATRGKDKQAEYEDVYPKSRTGLGGLYFANSSPSSVFRKDLAQTSTMMIVNPQSMTSDITTSIRIPETVFPTIANLPGGLISFTYHIEVVVDLFGRLNETRLWPRLTSSEPTFTPSLASGNQITTDWTHSILDTTQLRRTKSVITFEMSLVIGTVDSGRAKRLQKQPDVHVQETHPERHWPEEEWNGMYGDGQSLEGQHYDEWGYPYYDGYGYDGHGYDGPGGYEGFDGYGPHPYPEYPSPPRDTIPPPQPEEELDEKTRLRRQEHLLMPSQPPEDGESSGAAVTFAPTAPILPDPRLDAEGLHDGSVTPSSLHPASSVASARSADTIRPYSTSPPPASSAADHDVLATDDKQELERRRLMAQASAPPEDDRAGPSTSTAPHLTPSAPRLSGEDEYNAHTLNHDAPSAELPQYEPRK